MPAAYALYVRARLPESVRFLENKGRTAEAEEAVRAFESASGIEPVASPAADPVPPARWSELWSDGLRGRTAALWAAWFGVNFSYYGAFIWIPSLLVSQGFSLTKSFGFTLIITLAQLPGYAAAAFLIEAWGRRATLATFLAGSAISAYAFGQAGSEAAIIAAGCALSFFNLGAWGALYAVTPEVYPTSLRGTEQARPPPSGESPPSSRRCRSRGCSTWAAPDSCSRSSASPLPSPRRQLSPSRSGAGARSPPDRGWRRSVRGALRFEVILDGQESLDTSNQ